MNYCSNCGQNVTVIIPDGDHRERFVCPSCNTIFYENPRIITGTLPIYQGKILICKRGIEPRANYWTVPGGFMENGESMSDGAARETLEEACSRVEVGQLLSAISLPSVNQVHCFFLAEMKDDHFEITPESIEIKLIDIEDIPWDEIAFRTVEYTLRHYIEHRTSKTIPLLETSILPKRY